MISGPQPRPSPPPLLSVFEKFAEGGSSKCFLQLKNIQN